MRFLAMRLLSMRLLAACALATLLAAVPATAQQPGAGPQRATTATGATKPPSGAERGSTPGAPFSKASTEAQMLKAQRASAARDKAWDAKMRTTMGSICKGC